MVVLGGTARVRNCSLLFIPGAPERRRSIIQFREIDVSFNHNSPVLPEDDVAPKSDGERAVERSMAADKVRFLEVPRK